MIVKQKSHTVLCGFKYVLTLSISTVQVVLAEEEVLACCYLACCRRPAVVVCCHLLAAGVGLCYYFPRYYGLADCYLVLVVRLVVLAVAVQHFAVVYLQGVRLVVLVAADDYHRLVVAVCFHLPVAVVLAVVAGGFAAGDYHLAVVYHPGCHRVLPAVACRHLAC
jgi:hypothetical protein